MSLMTFLIPAALAVLVWGAVTAARDLRQRNALKLLLSAGAFALLAAGASVMMEFITRPL